jgi:hypothetical protein
MLLSKNQVVIKPICHPERSEGPHAPQISSQAKAPAAP